MGFAIHSFGWNGIKVRPSGSVNILGNYIGTDARWHREGERRLGCLCRFRHAYVGRRRGLPEPDHRKRSGGVFFAAPVGQPPLSGEGGLKTGSGGGGDVRWNQIGGNRDGSPGHGEQRDPASTSPRPSPILGAGSSTTTSATTSARVVVVAAGGKVNDPRQLDPLRIRGSASTWATTALPSTTKRWLLR
jgi:hypothetical protein